MQAQSAHFWPEIAGEFVVLIDLCSTRRNFSLREIKDRFADRIGGFAKVEIERTHGIGDHDGHSPEFTMFGLILNRKSRLGHAS